MVLSSCDAVGVGKTSHSETASSSLMPSIACVDGVAGTGGSVAPVSLAITWRIALYFGVGRPLSSSGLS